MFSIDRQIELPFVYDFDRALERLATSPVNAVDGARRMISIPMAGGNIVTLEGTGTTQQPTFTMQGLLDDLQLEEIKAIFHFDRSLDGIQEHFVGTDLEQLFIDHEGTPLIKSFSLYGDLMTSIIHQQLNLSFSHTLTQRFVESYGEQVDGVWRYPSPERIALLDVSELRDKHFSTRKAEYVIGLSQSIVEGKLELEQFKRMEDAEVVAKLVTFRGVGPWTAQNFLMFGLGRPNLFPLADIGLQNALKKLWGMDRKPTQEEMLARFADWSPYLSYAALYLWRSIE